MLNPARPSPVPLRLAPSPVLAPVSSVPLTDCAGTCAVPYACGRTRGGAVVRRQKRWLSSDNHKLVPPSRSLIGSWGPGEATQGRRGKSKMYNVRGGGGTDTPATTTKKEKEKKRRKKQGPLITQCRLADGTILTPVHPSSPDFYPTGRGLGLDSREPAFIDKSQIWGNSAIHSIHLHHPSYIMPSSHERQLRQRPAPRCRCSFA
ncbi:hypothetical protein LY76DRAFT_157703 [Colletotrichum caudatum]|nr:hypothetical protein LY76DRAFT_157703 [Colletotrichum caudatum]